MREDKICLKSFEELYHLHKTAVYQNIRKIVNDEEYSLDILQEVFLKLWDNRKEFDNQESVVNWLFVVSYHQSITFLRQKLNEAVLVTDEFQEFVDEESMIYENDSFQIQLKMRVLEEAMEVLPRRKKEVFQLYRLEGLSKEEVAEQLKISIETVKDYLNQSNQIIRKYVSIHYPSLLSLVFLILL